MTAEDIFNTKAEYNKWLKELTDSEKELVLEMINEAFRQCNVVGRSEQLVCDVCGSDDVIEAPHMGKNCNRCHPL